MKLNANNEQETRAIAAKLAEYLTAGDVILLEGNLGAGKTTFTKGLAEGLGIKRVVKSPTYTIIREYTEGRLPLYHMDVYRLEDTGDDIGLEEYINGDGVAIVETAHVELARSGSDGRSVGVAIDIERAHAADTLAAVVVEVNGLLAFLHQLFVEDVEHL